MRSFSCGTIVFALVSAAVVVMPSSAHADSCWDHNGSVMRLKAKGNERWMYYEIPREVLRDAGVQEGTLLFNGRKDGNWYSGTARRFSKYCIEDPLEYFVEGPARADQLQVTVIGMREVHKQCNPTGKLARDELIFTYIRDC
jgi:hypothetical protein